ncbi:MAG: transposase [Desulfovibrio sp.]|jgi:transposase-like protein|nr:transposase [Desulfovibrio sp.]
MGRKTFSAEQSIFKLREVEVLMGQGVNIAEACRKIAVTEQTYYRWRKEYGGMNAEQLKRLKELEKENVRLRRVAADLSLDKAILAGAAMGNF